MNARHFEREGDTFRIHIDAEPHRVKPSVFFFPKEGVKKSIDVLRKSFHRAPQSVLRRPRRHHKKTLQKHPADGGAWRFIKDKLEFAFVSAVVFGIIYVILNWSAISINIIHYWNVWRGFQSPLAQVTEDRPQAPERLISARDGEARGAAEIPPLNIEIYPTDTRIIIPRINQNVPVVGVTNENLIARKWDELESDIQRALRNGVVHYPGTALPGDNGNIVVTGHSSYYVWDPGRFKDVFALLHGVRLNDKIVVFFNQKKFVYQVDNIRTVLPQNVDVLAQTPFEQLTLITCTPIGTNLKRLIVTARLIEKS